MANPNLALLAGIAHALGPLREQVVFVGGCATGLLIDNPQLMDVRSTLAAEVGAAPHDVKLHIARCVAALLALPPFANALPGLLSDPEQEGNVLVRLGKISQFA
ncbi:hypothetical protein [Hydrogenophaga sp.]|uniref:hypothetical protein n=1 Tax=Hydrogenophaga sp. TaxID=1904254 RepID=UPI00391DB746